MPSKRQMGRKCKFLQLKKLLKDNMEFLTAYGLRHKELHLPHEKSWTSKSKIKMVDEETPKVWTGCTTFIILN